MYFYSTLSKGWLAAVPRSTNSVTLLNASMRALFRGPSDAERNVGFTTGVPVAAEVHDIELRNGVATIELLGSSGGMNMWSDAALAQLVFTATQFPTVHGVRVEVGSTDVMPHSAAGVADRPMTRSDFEGLSPQVLVEAPLYDQTIHSPVRISGTANTFEAAFQIEIADWNGRIVASQRAMATSGTGTRGTFDITVPYRVDHSGLGELITFVYSAKDGSRIVISETPLYVAP